MPRLICEFSFGTDLEVHDFGPGPYGHRQLVHGTGGGKVTGDRLNGCLMPPGGDWFLVGDDQGGRLDCRANIKTDDDALIYVQYLGILVLTPDVTAMLAGHNAEPAGGEQYFFTNPRLETGDERYAWVNHTMFLAQGRISPGPRVDYTVYRLALDE